ncbi:MAG: radical SAM protein, partial [Candidatus Electrothrix sp. ATG2]|nr:radical SAM protein [Candidatus Electrothrix sp. ATG2]
CLGGLVYQGNVRFGDGENTFCPACKTELIARTGFVVQSNQLAGGRCPKCGEKIEGVW